MSPARMSRLSRRRFLAGSAALGAAASAAYLAGCGESEPRPVATDATPAPTPSPAAAGTRGGVLRAYNFDAQTHDALDPHQSRWGPIVNIHSAVFSKLLRYDDEITGTIAPDLAAAMPEQPDQLTYIIRLREGVRFHDGAKQAAAYPTVAGRALNAADVKFSIERQTDREGARAKRFFHAGRWAGIDAIKVPDRQTLEIRLKTPLAPFTSFLAARSSFVIAPETIDRAAGAIEHPAGLIGTGPFVLESLETGVAARLRRNPDWFARDDDPDGSGVGRPFIDGVDSFFAPQEDTFQRAAFDRRLVDATGFVDPAALDAARTTNLGDILLEETDSGSVLASRFLLDRPPFNDDRVRRAIHLAIDRRALAALLFPPMDGRASAQLSGPIAPVIERWALPPDELARRAGYGDRRAEDIAQAKSLWSAAFGAAPPGAISVFFAGIPRTIPERAIAFLGRQLKEVLGVDVLPLVDPSGQAVIGSALGRNLDAATEGIAPCTFAFEDGGVDLDDWVYGQFRSGQPDNTYRLEDPTLDSLLDAQRAEFDEEARRKLGIDIQDYLLGNVNARIDYLAPVERRLVWGYVRGARPAIAPGSAFTLAGVWLDGTHPAWTGRPA